MTSIVMAAHNEEAVIERTLGTLLSDTRPGEFEVVVVANGCTDATSQVAARFADVDVVSLSAAGKAHALNVGDSVATRFPRIYLDADIPITSDDVRQLVRSMGDSDPAPLAATVRRHVGLAGSSWLVRAYYAVNVRLPVYRQALFGRGIVALTEGGRARFDKFPNQIADDLFLDSLFTREEKAVIESVCVTVMAPKSARDLVSRLSRVRRGNEEMRDASRRGDVPGDVRQPDSWGWLHVARDPRLLPAIGCYVLISMSAEIRARRSPSHEWGRDESRRSLDPGVSAAGGDK